MNNSETVKKNNTFIREFKGHTESVNHIVFSSDKKTIYSLSSDETIRAWNTKTGEEVKKFGY